MDSIKRQNAVDQDKLRREMQDLREANMKKDKESMDFQEKCEELMQCMTVQIPISAGTSFAQNGFSEVKQKKTRSKSTMRGGNLKPSSKLHFIQEAAEDDELAFCDETFNHGDMLRLPSSV